MIARYAYQFGYICSSANAVLGCKCTCLYSGDPSNVNKTYTCEKINASVPCKYVTMDEFGFKQYPKHDRYFAFLDSILVFLLIALQLRIKYLVQRQSVRDSPREKGEVYTLGGVFLTLQHALSHDIALFLALSIRAVSAVTIVGVAYLILLITCTALHACRRRNGAHKHVMIFSMLEMLGSYIFRLQSLNAKSLDATADSFLTWVGVSRNGSARLDYALTAIVILLFIGKTLASMPGIRNAYREVDRRLIQAEEMARNPDTVGAVPWFVRARGLARWYLKFRASYDVTLTFLLVSAFIHVDVRSLVYVGIICALGIKGRQHSPASCVSLCCYRFSFAQ